MAGHFDCSELPAAPNSAGANLAARIREGLGT